MISLLSESLSKVQALQYCSGPSENHTITKTSFGSIQTNLNHLKGGITNFREEKLISYQFKVFFL